MVPGDMIEWVCQNGNGPVEDGTVLYASVNRSLVIVPIDGYALLISVMNDDTYFWLGSKGMFSAKLNDEFCSSKKAAYAMPVKIA